MSDKVNLKEVAKEVGKEPKEILVTCKELGIKAAVINSSISLEEAEIVTKYILEGKKIPVKKKITPKESTSTKKITTKPTKINEVKHTKGQSSKNIVKDETEVNKTRFKTVEKGITKQENTNTTEAIKKIKKEVINPIQGIRKPTNDIKIINDEAVPAATDQMQGFRLLKKKNPLRSAKKTTKDLKAEFNYGKTKVANDFIDIEAEKKKAKAKKKTTKKDLGIKLNVLSDRDSFEFDDYQEEQVTFMPDLTVVSNISNYEHKPKKDNNKTATNALNRPKIKKTQSIARVSRKKHRYDKKDNSNDSIKNVIIEGEIRLYEFADKIGKTAEDLITLLMSFGVHVTKNDFLNEELLEILGEEYEINIHVSHNFATVNTQDLHKEEITEVQLITRAPIVSVMGHVDHGKTTLLDTIRKANVVNSEVGGITQQVNAYSVIQDNKMITFVDTPGHESFKAMRSRGATLTDIVIIVVAADDGVMPTTREAVKAAKNAKSSIIIAINKIDKEAANIDKVKGEMSELGLTPVDWGGEYEFIPISALKGEGVDNLLDTINIQAELLELKANKLAPAKASILESTLEKGRGVCTSLVITDGVLKIADFVIAGSSFGRIKAIFDDKGQKVKELAPSQPGTILGFDKSPNCGDILTVIRNDKKAREITKQRKSYSKQKEHSLSIKANNAQDVYNVIREKMLKGLNVIIRADREGSLEVIKNDLLSFKNEEVKTNILNAAVGEISENDIILASSGTLLITFNVKTSAKIKKKAEKMGVKIYAFEIIYELFDFIKEELGKLITPISQELVLGSAEVRQLFQFGKEGVIAGSMVLDGYIKKDTMIRVSRAEQEVFFGKVNALKRFKDDVKEVSKGYDCGISLVNFNDFKEGDVLQSITQENIKMKFEPSKQDQESYYERV